MNAIKKFKRFIIKILKKIKFKQIYICPVCNKNVNFSMLPKVYLEKFEKHSLDYSISQFETLNIENYSCNNCMASDRDRLIALFLKKYFNQNKRKLNLLDFAPSIPLFQFIKGFNLNYRSTDLLMENVDDKVDIRNMDIYKDNSFDVFICSHVLEHVDDDVAAMEELYRITKKKGIGVLLVPIMLSIEESIEDKKYLKSKHLRWKYFGQDDHVRMYSKKDFVQRLLNVGFKVSQYGMEYFGDSEFQKCGIDSKSVLYVVEK